MRKNLVGLLTLVLTMACSTQPDSKIHIDSNTGAFEKNVNPSSSANVVKYELFIEGPDKVSFRSKRVLWYTSYESNLRSFECSESEY